MMNTQRKAKLIDLLKVYFALPPYNQPYNISAYDNYFWKSIKEEYTKEEIEECRSDLGL